MPLKYNDSYAGCRGRTSHADEELTTNIGRKDGSANLNKNITNTWVNIYVFWCFTVALFWVLKEKVDKAEIEDSLHLLHSLYPWNA